MTDAAPFTVEHFRQFARLVVWDDQKKRDPEPWQMEMVTDLFSGFARNLWIVPEGNGKSSFTALIALYGAAYTESPWIPIGAASAKQARIIHDQATGFVQRTPGLKDWFKPYGGYLRIKALEAGGIGIEVFAHDPKTGDGVIPYPYALLDELHRHPDMRLWDLWAGKLRKRGAQILGISTAGEPETPFELMRDAIRNRAQSRQRNGAHLRAVAENEVLHEWMVPSDALCSDMAAVKAANPLSTISIEGLTQDFALVTNLGDWKRLKCNRPTRSIAAAITDKEWDEAYSEVRIPEAAEIDVGADIAFKWDCTALIPLWRAPRFRLLGEPKILTPPRDHSSMHPDEIKAAFYELATAYKIRTVVMDMHRAEDIAAWVEDELGVTVIDHDHRQMKVHVQDYESFMDGLRNSTVKHTGDQGLRVHVLNAIARRLPGGDYRFDRPAQSRGAVHEQDRRVVDGLTAAAMVVQHSTRAPQRRSVYEDRGLLTA